MTDLRKAAEMALDAMLSEYSTGGENKYSPWDVIEALRQALAQPEQEPKLSDAGVDTNIPLWGLEPKGSGMVALHQRKWVGLTDDDMHTIRGDAFNKNVDDMNWAVAIARKIDFILRKRNT